MNYSCAGNLHINLLILKRTHFSQPGQKKKKKKTVVILVLNILAQIPHLKSLKVFSSEERAGKPIASSNAPGIPECSKTRAFHMAINHLHSLDLQPFPRALLLD